MTATASTTIHDETARPTSEMQERIARALFERRLRQSISDENWAMHVKSFRELSAGWPKYSDGSDAISDAFRDALAAMKAMREPTRVMIDAAYGAHDAYEAAPPPKAWCGLSSAFRAAIGAEISLAEGSSND